MKVKREVISKIKHKIKRIEKEEKIKVLFLIESGSRAWGWESEDSDYDIRGVFVQDYLKVPRIPKQLNKKIGDFDIELWDLKKFLRLMLKSNPTIWEWLSSDIVYIDGSIRSKLKKMFKRGFKRYALKKHYVSMAQQNFKKYIKDLGETANLKKYVYVLRSVACVLWIEKYKSPPPKHYKKVIKLLPKNAKLFFEKIVRNKRKSESLRGERNKEIERYIVSFFNKEFEKDESNFDIEKINKIFRAYSKKIK